MKGRIFVLFLFFILWGEITLAQDKDFNIQPINSNNFVAIFPNPTSNPFFYVKTQQILTRIEVIDLAGNTVYLQNLGGYYSEKMKIQLPNNTKKGLYLVKLYFDDNSTVIKKLIYR